MNQRIKLSHGNGNGQNELLNKIIFPCLMPDNKGPYEDAGVIKNINGKIAFSTDSFVVNPLFFPGGDIGKLAVCGTVNDLSMMGGIPSSISVSLILEEGLEIQKLEKILISMRKTCSEAGVTIECGDTKVVNSGKADGIYITTSGVGLIPDNIELSAANAKPGNIVIVSGPIGLHGIAVMAARKSFNFASDAVSDCAPLNVIVKNLLDAVPETKTLRDCTRGGTAAVLNEIALSSGVSINLQEDSIPVPEVVKGACSFLGLDPLHIPCEGRFVAIVPEIKSKEALNAVRNHPFGKGAEIIGNILKKERFPVTVETEIGGRRILGFPPGELLPRIC
jgi:hydrogenase expression/formation protein HypE